jgi:replication-associated recombination protein RarA
MWPNQTDKDYIMKVINDEEFDHILLYGLPGTGKSTATKIFAEKFIEQHAQLMAEIIQPGASETGVKMVEAVEEAVSLVGTRAVLIDEIDNLSLDAQKKMRRVIDVANKSKNARLFCTTNYACQIEAALFDRFYPVRWEFPEKAMVQFATWVNEKHQRGKTNEQIAAAVARSGTSLRSLLRYL